MTLERLLAIPLLVASAAAPAAPTRADWKLLPADVRAVAQLDMTALGSSTLYRALLGRHADRLGTASGDYLAFVRSTGFDFTEDLDTLTLGAGGDARDVEAPFYVIVSGRFDREKIEQWVAASGDVSTASFEGLRTYSPAVDVNSGPPPTAAFVDERTLLIASSADFGKLVAAVRGRGRLARDSSLAQLMSSAVGQLRIAIEVPPSPASRASGETAEVASVGIGMFLDQLQSAAAGPLAGLQSLLLTLDARTGVDVAIRAAAASPEAGKLVHDQLAGYLLLGRAVAAQRPELADWLGRLELEQSGSSVRVSMKLSAEDVEAAIAGSQTSASSRAGG